jgi:(p)ppGpp synthase/HD superfamily hydrolase
MSKHHSSTGGPGRPSLRPLLRPNPRRGGRQPDRRYSIDPLVFTMTSETTDTARLLAAAKFAAQRHAAQRRKGADAAPYVNHCIEVAETLCRVGGVRDADVLVAALLHDTVEDTGTKPGEIEERFGRRVREIVEEVTDDMSLPKARRKELQVEHAPHLSAEAKQVKLADKTANVREVAAAPPPDWPQERRVEYLAWAESVVAGLRGVNRRLEDNFDRALHEARQRLAGVA